MITGKRASLMAPCGVLALPIPPLPILLMTTDPSPPPHCPQPEEELTELPEAGLNYSCPLSGVCLVLTGSSRGFPHRALCLGHPVYEVHTIQNLWGQKGGIPRV